MIYHAVRQLIRIALAVFFKKIVVSGSENIPDKGPLIIVANHPNTLMDPLIVASIFKQKIGFVANAGIFGNKVLNAVFNYFHVIPIFRKKDVKTGEKPDNSFSFSKCHEFLNQNGTFLIFPEGNSVYELNLREIKTGTARIALSFEKEYGLDRKLKILPVALDYSDSIQFRSLVSVTIHTPVAVSDFSEAYQNDEAEGVKQLTEYIRKTLAKNIPQTSGKEQEDYLIKVHKFYSAYYEPGSDLYINPRRSLELRRQLAGALHFTFTENIILYTEIQKLVTDYFRLLKTEKLTTGFFSEPFLKKSKVILLGSYLLKFIFLSPFFVIGIITNYLPYRLPEKIYEALKTDIEYKTPIELISGLITFPLFYALEIWLFRKYVSPETQYTLLLFVLLPVSGFIALYYSTEVRRFVRLLRFYFVVSPENKISILKLRDDILNKIEEARISFLQKRNN
jgi:glycerol-3-phosphate O-acyltransferase/dihydroxyacetone phosphate acyltransferase